MGPSLYPPSPSNPVINIRTGQSVDIDLISGIAYNPGYSPSSAYGGSSPSGFTGQVSSPSVNGGSLVSPSVPVTSVTIVKPPLYSTFFGQTGSTGNYRYTPPARFGTDQMNDYFTFKVTDSSGVMSRDIGTCTLRPLNIPQNYTDPQFIYCTGSQVRAYNVSGETVIFNNPLPTAINGIATNRDDCLIYYVIDQSAQDNEIYAYDYIADIHFALTRPIIFPPISFGDAACYRNSILYVGKAFGSNNFYRVSLQPYIPGSGMQNITSIVEVETGLSSGWGDIECDPSGSRVIIANSGNPSGIIMVDSLSGVTLSSQTLSLSGGTQVVFGYDGALYLVQGTSIYTLPIVNGASNLVPVFTGINKDISVDDVSEWRQWPIEM